MRRGRLAEARADAIAGLARYRGASGGGSRLGGRLGTCGWRCQLTALFRRELLIFLPLLLNVLTFLRGQLLQGLVLLSRDAALVRREARPSAHLLPNALLLRRWHAWITFGDPQPLLFALGVQLVPLRREGGQYLLFAGRKISPGRRAKRERTRAGRHGQQEGKRADQHPPARPQGSGCFSQFWNPRSRYASMGRSGVRMAASISSISCTRCTDCH